MTVRDYVSLDHACTRHNRVSTMRPQPALTTLTDSPPDAPDPLLAFQSISDAQTWTFKLPSSLQSSGVLKGALIPSTTLADPSSLSNSTLQTSVALLSIPEALNIYSETSASLDDYCIISNNSYKIK